MSKTQRLTVGIEKDELVIRIGIDTLTFAFEYSEMNNPFDEDGDSGEFIRQYRVIDMAKFAEDVVTELNVEEEDGTTPLHRLLDQAFESVLENGGFGIEPCKGEPKERRAGGESAGGERGEGFEPPRARRAGAGNPR